MDDIKEFKTERLDRIITVRMSERDYKTLQTISENKQSNMSDLIRTVVDMVINVAGKNNIKGK